MRRLSAFVIGLFFLVNDPSHVSADDSTLAKGYCYEMEGTINALADFTYTKCLPSKGAEGMSFIFISSEPVFSAPDAKKAWLLVVVASFGNTFNKNTMKSEEILVSDQNLITQGVTYRMPALTARALQHQIKNNQIDLETMYRGILKALKKYHIQS